MLGKASDQESSLPASQTKSLDAREKENGMTVSAAFLKRKIGVMCERSRGVSLRWEPKQTF